MKDNFYDEVLEEIETLTDEVITDILNDFKSVKPFDKKIATPKERLSVYFEMTPETEMGMRQAMGDGVVDDYRADMEELRGRQLYG